MQIAAARVFQRRDSPRKAIENAANTNNHDHSARSPARIRALRLRRCQTAACPRRQQTRGRSKAAGCTRAAPRLAAWLCPRLRRHSTRQALRSAAGGQRRGSARALSGDDGAQSSPARRFPRATFRSARPAHRRGSMPEQRGALRAGTLSPGGARVARQGELIAAMSRRRALTPAKRIQYARCDIPNRWAESAGHILAIPVGPILCSRNAH